MKQKGYSLPTIIIVIAVLLVGVGVYYFGTIKNKPQSQVVTPSPSSSDQTANWKTYTNTDTGIEFKYPETWTAKSYSGKTFNIMIDDHPFDIPAQGEFRTSIGVHFNEWTNTVTNQNYYVEKTLSEGVSRTKDLLDPSTIKIKNLSVGGKNATQISGEGTGMLSGYLEYTLIQLDNRLLIIELSNKNFEDIYQKILSTFKFTGQNQITENTPETVTSDFYQWYLSCLTKHFKNAMNGTGGNKTPAEDCPYESNNNVSPELKNNIEADYAKNGGGYDHVFCAQDLPVSITFDKANVSSNRTAVVVVHPKLSMSPPYNINVGLQAIDNQWKISSVNCNR